MFKLFGLAIVVFSAFLGLFIFGQPRQSVEQWVATAPEVVEENSSTTEIVDGVFDTVCYQAATEEFGENFAELDTAVDYCVLYLFNAYTELGHWPGPAMYGNVSEAFFAAQNAANAWGLLDTPYIYYAEHGRDTIMKYMKEQRLALGL